MEKTPFHEQYEALKDKQAHLEMLMVEQARLLTIMERRRFRLTLVYVILVGVSVWVGSWLL